MALRVPLREARSGYGSGIPGNHLPDLCQRYLELLRLALPDDVGAVRATGRVLPSDIAIRSLPEQTVSALSDIYDEFVREYCDEMIAKVPTAPRREVEKRATEFFAVAVSNLPDDETSAKRQESDH